MDLRRGAVSTLSERGGFMRMLPSAWAREPFFLRFKFARNREMSLATINLIRGLSLFYKLWDDAIEFSPIDD